MNIHTVSELSGLSRGQIDQLISRWGVTPHGKARPGGAREFTLADCFAFCVAGHAARMGVSQPGIRDIIGALPMPKLSRDTFEQVEVFPGRAVMRNAWLVVAAGDDGELRGEFVEASQLKSVAGASMIFPASQIAAAIEEAAAQ